MVLDGVDLSVSAGEAVALLGANGAGKTTLLKILATLVKPTRGRATVAGSDCARDPEAVRCAISVLAHGAYLYEDLTALENLGFWSEFSGWRASAETLHAALADVDLAAFADEQVRSFSAGMRRRLGLARLTLASPRVLLLDEPFAGLDARARKWLEERLAAFKERGGAVLMSTHSFARDLGTVDRIAILAGGRIALDVPRGRVDAEELRRLYAVHTEDAV